MKNSWFLRLHLIHESNPEQLLVFKAPQGTVHKGQSTSPILGGEGGGHQTNKQADRHVDSMTDPAQRVESVKSALHPISKKKKKKKQ